MKIFWPLGSEIWQNLQYHLLLPSFLHPCCLFCTLSVSKTATIVGNALVFKSWTVLSYILAPKQAAHHKNYFDILHHLIFTYHKQEISDLQKLQHETYHTLHESFVSIKGHDPWPTYKKTKTAHHSVKIMTLVKVMSFTNIDHPVVHQFQDIYQPSSHATRSIWFLLYDTVIFFWVIGI